MYESTEVIIRLNSGEVQQAMAIWLDNDAEQALRLIKEKIVDKTLRTACKHSEGRQMAPCHLTRSNCSCCRAGSAAKGNVTVGGTLRRHGG